MTTQPLTDEQHAAIRAQLGDVKPATDDLIASLAKSVRDRRTHDHPTGNEDWFCANLAGWAGDRTAVVLRRLLGAEAEAQRLRAELDEDTGVMKVLRRQRDEAEAERDRLRAALTEALQVLDAGPQWVNDRAQQHWSVPAARAAEILRGALNPTT